MQNYLKILFKNKLSLILLVGGIARIIFVLFIGDIYFSRQSFFIDNDTYSWANSFQNLIESGQYTLNPESEFGFFGRMPGYSFFIGIFWLIIRNWELVFPIVVWVQIMLDIFSIWLVYKISESIFKKKSIALISAFLYSFYPFIIVWNPIVYSESVSVFLMLLSFFFFLKKKPKDYFWSGFTLGWGILFRPQLMFLIPVFWIFILIFLKGLLKKPILLFALALILSYGIWPLRNYFNYNKTILTQDLRGINGWNTDVLSFMQYIYAVKPEWEPQFTSIIQNKKTTWPKEAYLSKNDSMLLEHAVCLSKTCGSGFSYWSGYWSEHVPNENSCTKEITAIFTYLRNNQILKNPFNFWVRVPLLNLKKAVFKNSLVKVDSPVKKLASLLFYYRTFLIILGLIGIFIMLKQKILYAWIFLFFFVFLYFTLCFGTSPQMRNIEIRYFLHADVLLLIPASYFFWIISKSFKINRH